jgi:hypothetical protein
VVAALLDEAEPLQLFEVRPIRILDRLATPKPVDQVEPVRIRNRPKRVRLGDDEIADVVQAWAAQRSSIGTNGRSPSPV